MRLMLNSINLVHQKLRGIPTDYHSLGGLALQREGHASPAAAEIVENHFDRSTGEIVWLHQDTDRLEVLDTNRITEDGAEAIALTYVNERAGWIVKRRRQRNESGDWLLQNGSRWLVLEVSGTRTGDFAGRLAARINQVSGCTLRVNERIAVVVDFQSPTIAAGTP